MTEKLLINWAGGERWPLNGTGMAQRRFAVEQRCGVDVFGRPRNRAQGFAGVSSNLMRKAWHHAGSRQFRAAR